MGATMGGNHRTWDIRTNIFSPVDSGEMTTTSFDCPGQAAIMRWRSCSVQSLDNVLHSGHKIPPQEYEDQDGESSTSLAFVRKSDPQAGSTYIILDVSQTRALTCHKGKLRLEPVHLSDDHVSEQAQWFCTARNGFKGFKNVAEGKFLGHDVFWDFYASASNHSLWESFTIARRPGGLYWLQILHWWTQWQVTVREDGSGVFAELEDGTDWEFVKVLSMGE
ncbi:hypothetical protein FPOAC2_11845 [Fusarium poae]|jgi:hypothetical protein|nr:hypothetical protein FPOAC1_011538 [Fusarium poae]KAG8666724.1 hypothetical protein FPOAC1_011538 [Fusarium poae]